MDKNPKRERFMKEATELLSEKGYKAMTMRVLADRLECDKSNIYNYISSKQELLDVLLFEIADKFHQGISEIESSSHSAIDKLKAIIKLHISMTYENPYKMNIHANEWKFLDEKRKKLFVKRRKNYENKISEIVSEGITEKAFKKGNPNFQRNCILSSLRWLYTWNISDRNNVKQKEVEEITEFILKGISVI